MTTPHKKPEPKFNSYSLNKIYDFDYKHNFINWENGFSKIEKPSFANSLEQEGFVSVRKVFESLGLKDVSCPSRYWFRRIDFWFKYFEGFVNLLQRRPLFSQQDNLFKNLITEDSKICFSADPWDIATMSMRGLKSCMSWESRQSVSLVGSILDPYCAIIYLSPLNLQNLKRKKYGSEMLARSVVRYVRDQKGDPALYLEELYLQKSLEPNNKDNKEIIQSGFIRYLHKKTGMKIICHPQPTSGLEIPFDDELISLPSIFYSYRDSKISYSKRF